jgi:porphobilinogen synthase
MDQRRIRRHPLLRELAAEVIPNYRKFVQPLFVAQGIKQPNPVPGLGETCQDSPDSLLAQIDRDLERGVHKFILFGVPQSKAESSFDFSFTAEQIQRIKQRFGRDLWLAVDVCLCSYSSHGHCGVLTAERDHVCNARTLPELAAAGLAYAQAGADCVAPSDMMDGRVRAMREQLDRAQLDDIALMSYSAKFSSRFYGPFRVAADSAPKGDCRLNDRSTYQISPGNYRDALASSLRDAQEGADILMVKPALPYLDVLWRLSQAILTKPWAAYEVSGEYAGREFLAAQGMMDARAGHVEAWTGIFRAGAQMVISYGARHARDYLG